MGFEVTFWGTRGSRPAPSTRARETERYGGNTSCAEVRTPAGDRIILDSGTGIAALGDSLGDQPLDALLLITHTHWDHIQGLPFFKPLYRADSVLDIRGPNSATVSMAEALRMQMATPFFPVHFEDSAAHITVAELALPEPFEWRGVTITPYDLNHAAPTFGYRLDIDGASLVYATDNELRPVFEESDRDGNASRLGPLVTWASGTDLLIHDAQYSEAEYAEKRGWGHSTFDDVVRLRKEAGARELALWHHDPSHTDADMAAHVAAAAAGESAIYGAAEGMSVTVPNRAGSRAG